MLEHKNTTTVFNPVKWKKIVRMIVLTYKPYLLLLLSPADAVIKVLYCRQTLPTA